MRKPAGVFDLYFPIHWRSQAIKLLTASLLVTAALLGARTATFAQDAPVAGVKVITDVAYKDAPDLTDYEKTRCKLDLYLPADKKGFSTLVWFHGGGLTGGGKPSEANMAKSLVKAGIAVVAANYRLSPKVKYPSYLQDAAAAFAWTKSHIAAYGGDAGKVFVGGHSAGGYIAFMISLDAQYLAKFNVPLSGIAGVIPISGQTMTHYTVREERGIGMWTITADEAAPVHYGRKDTPPMLVLYADHDMAARKEENEYFVAEMKGAGNEHVQGLLISDRNHNSIAGRIANEDDPARLAIIKFVGDPMGER